MRNVSAYIDTTRIFASGHSRGAAMALIAALEMPDVIAGSAVESGFTEFGYFTRIVAHQGRKTPIVLVHGVLDMDVPIAKGGDDVAKDLRSAGWTDDNLLYFRLANVGHRWQPQLNQEWFEFLAARPLGWQPP
jgi:poly(3-hydroxybutyrate) depolymerase